MNKLKCPNCEHKIAMSWKVFSYNKLFYRCVKCSTLLKYDKLTAGSAIGVMLASIVIAWPAIFFFEQDLPQNIRMLFKMANYILLYCIVFAGLFGLFGLSRPLNPVKKEDEQKEIDAL